MTEYKKSIFQGGAIIAAISTLSLFIGDKSAIKQIGSILTFVVLFGVPIYYGRKYVKTHVPQNECFGYGDALKYAMLQLVCGMGISSLVSYLYIMVSGADAMVAKSIESLEASGQAITQEMIDSMTMMYSNSWILIMSSFGGTLLMSTILSLICAIFIYRRDSEVTPIEE